MGHRRERSARRFGAVMVTALALTAGACATPISIAEFEATRGVAAPVQPDPAALRSENGDADLDDLDLDLDDFDDLDDVFDRDDSDDEDESPAPVGGGRSDASVGFGDGAAVVATALARLGGERALVGVTLYDGYASVTGRQTSSGDVHRVTVRGGRAEAPVAVGGTPVGNPQAAGFAPSDLDWGLIPGLVARTPADLGIGDGVVSHVTVERNLPFTPELVIRVYVTHPRRGGRIDYFADGRPMRAFED
jgi:hypothetical protein